MDSWDPTGSNTLDFADLPEDLYALFLQPVRKEEFEATEEDPDTGEMVRVKRERWAITESRRRHRVGGVPDEQTSGIENGLLVRRQRTKCTIANAEFVGDLVRVRKAVCVPDPEDDLDDGHMLIVEKSVSFETEETPSAVVLNETYMPGVPVWPEPHKGATHVRIGVVRVSQFDGPDRRPVEPIMLVPVLGKED